MKLLIDMNLTPLWAEVFTHDLDFGALLVATSADGPSAIQVRTQDVTPQHLEGIITGALRQHATLREGAVLITIGNPSAWSAWTRALPATTSSRPTPCSSSRPRAW